MPAFWQEEIETVMAAEPVMYVARMDVFLNQWFSTYEAAKACRERDGGFLLPYGSQYFVATVPAIRELGLDPEDPDWEKIGHDWVKPLDQEARERLVVQRLSAL